MSAALVMDPFLAANTSSAALMMDGGSGTQHQQLQLQPVFIPRQHHAASSHGLSGGAGGSGSRTYSQHLQPGSPTSNSNNNNSGSGNLAAQAAAASADWAYLLRNAAALRPNGGSPQQNQQQHQQNQQHQQGRVASPQVMTSPSGGGNGGFMSRAPSRAMSQGGLQHQHAAGGSSNSASGLFASNSMANNLDALGQLSAEALASATGDASNSFVMLPNGALHPTLSYHNDGVQTLYGSNDTAAVAAAAAAAAAARATTTHSILQQQATAAAASNASLANSLGSGALFSSNSLNLNSLMQLEESLSGSLFGPGGAAATLSPKPVSASLYVKNLPTDAGKLLLYEKFSPYGAILSVKVLSDPQSGQCRGVGFVNFTEHSSAVRSIQALHGTKVGDKLLHVSLQTPRLRAAALGL